MGVVVTKRDNSEAPSFLGVNSILNDISNNKQRHFNNDYNLATTFDDPEAKKRLKIGGLSEEQLSNFMSNFRGGQNEDAAGSQIPPVLQKAGESRQPVQLSDVQKNNAKTMTESAIFSNDPLLNIQYKDKNGETVYRNMNYREMNPEMAKAYDDLSPEQKQFQALSANFERVYGRQGKPDEIYKAQSEGRIYANNNNPASREEGMKAVNNAPNRMQQILNGQKPGSIYDPKTIQDPSDAQRMAIIQQGMTPAQTQPQQQMTQQPGSAYNKQSPNYMSNFLHDYMNANKEQKLLMALSAMESGNMTPQLAAGMDAITNSNVQGQFKANNSLPLQKAAVEMSVAEDAAKKKNWYDTQSALNSQSTKKGGGGNGSIKSSADNTGLTPKQQADLDMKQQNADLDLQKAGQNLRDDFFLKDKSGKPSKKINTKALYDYNIFQQKFGGRPTIQVDGVNQPIEVDWDSPEYLYFRDSGPVPAKLYKQMQNNKSANDPFAQ